MSDPGTGLRVLVISANREHLPDPVFPLGAAYVAGAAAASGHAVRTLDVCFSEDPARAVAAAIEENDPQVVAISLRNLDSSAYPQATSYIDDYADLVKAVRNACGAPIVLGGPAFTITPKAILNRLGADFGIAGEGERALPWLLERLARAEPVETSPEYVCASAGSGVCIEPVARLDRFEEAPLGRSSFDVRRYYESGGALNIQTKRGCCFDCVFCSYPLIEGSRIRTRSPRAVADEIQAVREKWDVRHWFMVDNIFNVPIGHAKEVCEEISARDLGIEWSAYLTPRFMDDELCRLMARSGCRAIEFGTDAGSPAIIAKLKKEFDVGDLRRASALCHAHGLKFCHSLVFGGPGESVETVAETLALMEELQPAAVIAMTGIRVLPGTEMVAIALRDGQIDPDDDLLYPRFYVAPTLGDELIGRIEAYARRHANWVVPGMGIKMNVQVLRKLRERRIKGPLWRLLG